MSYAEAKAKYAALRVDVEAAMEKLKMGNRKYRIIEL